MLRLKAALEKDLDLNPQGSLNPPKALPYTKVVSMRDIENECYSPGSLPPPFLHVSPLLLGLTRWSRSAAGKIRAQAVCELQIRSQDVMPAGLSASFLASPGVKCAQSFIVGPEVGFVFGIHPEEIASRIGELGNREGGG
eukprot:766356-Hanusia_phi.AAC.3